MAFSFFGICVDSKKIINKRKLIHVKLGVPLFNVKIEQLTCTELNHEIITCKLYNWNFEESNFCFACLIHTAFLHCDITPIIKTREKKNWTYFKTKSSSGYMVIPTVSSGRFWHESSFSFPFLREKKTNNKWCWNPTESGAHKT